MAELYCAIGLMSGTSMDGVDVAAIETDGERVAWMGPSSTVPYAPALRARLDRAVRDPERAADDLAVLAKDLTDAHAAAVEAFLPRLPAARRRVDVIGFHGHTLFHRPAERRTCQLGDGEAPGRAARHRRGLRLSQRRRRRGRAGRAARPRFPSGACGDAGKAACDAQSRRGGQRDLDRRALADRVRHRAGQRPDRRLGARARRSALRCRWPDRGGGAGRRGPARASAGASLLRSLPAQVARPAGFPAGADRGPRARGRRSDARGVYRPGRRAGARASAAAAPRAGWSPAAAGTTPR